MTDPKLLKTLQKFFWWAACVLVALTFFSIGMMVYMHLHPAPNLFGLLDRASVWDQLGAIIDGVAKFSFAFLMSTVFGLLGDRQAVDLERGNRFLKITVIAFALEALYGEVLWFKVHSQHSWSCSGSLCDWEVQLLNLVSPLTTFLTNLTPALFAVTIYILYRHFTRMVEFEAGVV